MNKDEIKETKKQLDRLNYGLPLQEKGKDNGELTSADYKLEDGSKVLSAYKNIKNELTDDYHVGVISAGSHSLDFEKFYGFSMGDDWHGEKKVMFVYECPAANSNYSLAGSYLKFKKSDLSDDFQQHLCSCLWHVEEKNKVDDNKKTVFTYFKEKGYGSFLQAMIQEFKLADFYTTNMIRYEIFSENEKALNFSGVEKHFGDKEDKKGNKSFGPDSIFFSVFKEELDIFHPDLIFATSNPYKYLNYFKDNKDWGNILNGTVLVKVPHPASHLTTPQRYLQNFFNIIRGLEKVGIITPEEARKRICDVYDNYPEKDFDS